MVEANRKSREGGAGGGVELPVVFSSSHTFLGSRAVGHSFHARAGAVAVVAERRIEIAGWTSRASPATKRGRFENLVPRRNVDTVERESDAPRNLLVRIHGTLSSSRQGAV